MKKLLTALLMSLLTVMPTMAAGTPLEAYKKPSNTPVLVAARSVSKPKVKAKPPISKPKPSTVKTSPAKRRALIKGNINSKGERIYHTPGSRYYDRTKLDTSKGERWFETEAQARAAGWRAPKQ